MKRDSRQRECNQGGAIQEAFSGSRDRDTNPIFKGKIAMRTTMTQQRTCILVMCVHLLVVATVDAKPPATCKLWNTAEFFRETTVEGVTACLAAGADPNARGAYAKTPLHFAAEFSQDRRVVQALLDAGADPMAREAYKEHTPLHKAAMAGASFEVIEALLAAGADVNVQSDHGTPLQAALKIHSAREPAAIEALLAAGADPNVTDGNGWTPLHYAAYDADDAKIIKLLLAAGAVVDAQSYESYHGVGRKTPLHLAVSSDADPAAVKVLLAAGAQAQARDSRGSRPLHLVKTKEALVYLLAAGAEVNARSDAGGFTPLHSAGDLSSPAIELLLGAGADVNARDDYGRTPLHYIARDNDSAYGVELLLNAGADPEARGRSGDTPLHYAARGNGSPAVFKVLLAAGIDVNGRNRNGQTPLFYAAKHNENPAALQALMSAGGDVNVRAHNMQTLLHAVAYSENITAAELLLKAGMEVSARDEDDRTPLHIAATFSGWFDDARTPRFSRGAAPIYGSTAVVKALLAAGAEVNARDDGDWTPLHCAARWSRNPEILEVLLAAGADPDAKNRDGRTPLYWASRRQPLEIREVLRAHPLPSGPVGANVMDVRVFRDCSTCPELVVVPAGEFRMGCVFESNAFWSKDNLPTHEVGVTTFAISRFEVTRGQFAAFVAATGYDVSDGCQWKPGSWRDQDWQGDDHPVVCVNWHDAQAYVKWLCEETGHQYRLPSEAEWEYAIRAGTKTRFHWGYRVHDLGEYENSGKYDDGWERTAPVGSFKANRFGLYDMAGNVSEWVEDCWHENYIGAPQDGSAWTHGGDCGRRVVRGGIWESYLARHYRSSYRHKSEVGSRDFRIGFRVARSLDAP